MASAAFDALKFVDDLEAVKFPREQARVIVELVRSSHDIADVATKADLANLEQRLETKFGKLDAKINSVEQGLNGKIDLLRKDMLSMESGLRKDMESMQSGLRKDMEAMQLGTRKDMDSMQQGMQKDMSALENRLIIKLGLMMAALLGITGTIVGIVLRVMLKSV